MATDEYSQAVTVCNVNDLRENEMKQMAFNETLKILVIKQRGNITAIGNKCPHYGAPLHTGVLGKGVVRCPWHGACFNIETGDIEDFPGLDSVPCYKVEVAQNGEVKVRAKKSELVSTKRHKEMAKINVCNRTIFLIVGGGPAGGVCAETLRQQGYTGRIVLACRESFPPYDRVKVSKAMDSEIDRIQFRSLEYYQNNGIEVWLGAEAISIDTKNKRVNFKDGALVDYEKCFIATGLYPIRPEIPGIDELGNIFTVRDYNDAKCIYKLVKPTVNVVCLGSSFIALESAAFLVSKVKSVTVVGRDDLPLKAVFGNEIGQRLLKLFEENKVTMKMENGIEEILGKHKVSEVKLKDGTVIPCDILIIGIGTGYYTQFLQDSNVELNERGAINVDLNLKTNCDDLYAGGDASNAPIFSINNERASIGHYQLAQYHGRIAAINMTGGNKQLHAVPFFFTMIFGKGLRYSGYGRFKTVLISGSLEEFKFIAYYINEEDKVVAVASCGRDPIVAAFAEIQSQGKTLYAGDVEGLEDPPMWLNKIKNI